MSTDEMQGRPPLPPNIVVFGPGGNCTLDLCPVEYSVYRYQPSLAANVIFIALFGLAMIAHIFVGVRWKSWWFMIFMILGCNMEMIGYGGRVILHGNPFSFAGFMLQITCVTGAPVFYTAAIYVTLSKTINHFGADLSRIQPKWFYWFFIPADMVCLCLQAAGGALSTISKGVSDIGVDLAMAGLVMQVIFIVLFCVLFGDYMIRYYRNTSKRALTTRERLFFGFLGLATVLILGRCIYRCYELSEGYSSDLISDEPLFIGLEGVLVYIAVLSLLIGHPGFIFRSGQGMQPLGRVSEDVSLMEIKPAEQR